MMKKNLRRMMYGALLVTPIAVYAVLQDDGLNTSGNNTVDPGSDSVAIGSGNTVDENGLAVGENNTTTAIGGWGGKNNLVVGVGNSGAGRAAITVGTSNISGLSDSAVFGTGNNCYAGSSLLAGSGNLTQTYQAGSNNILLGSLNICGYASTDNVMLGSSNSTTSHEDKNWILGEGNLGTGGAVTLGTYCVPTPGASLIVGTGDDTTSSNGLVVMKDGDIIMDKVQGDIPMGIYGQ